MTSRKKWIGFFAAAGLAVAGISGPGIFRNIEFARAEQQVEATRAELANVQDMANVYKAVNKVLEPSVVEIQVTKTIKVPAARRFNQDFFRRFMPQNPQSPNGNNGNGGNGNNNDNDNDDNNSNDPTQPDEDTQEQQQQGTGSGVIMDVDGSTAFILTNNHVAGDASEMTVKLSDGRTIEGATLVGADPKSDLAVVKITADNLIAAKFGDSEKLEKGDLIVAFGAPFGYVGSMTHGIVSALHRNAGIIQNRYNYENFIQVDAPINPGNSGGPLVNLKGEVVGINTAIATESGGFQGIGFAIPSAQAKYVYDTIKTHGKVIRGWLGVEIADVADARPEMLSGLGYTEHKGVLVRGVLTKSPALEKLQGGDIITALDDKPVTNSQDLRYQIAKIAPGTAVKLTVFHEKKEATIEIKLGEQPEDPGQIANANGPRRGNGGGAGAIDSLGLRAATMSDELAQRFNVSADTKGVVITGFRGDAKAARSVGLQPGDVITKVNTTAVASVDELNDALGKADLGKGVRVYWTNADGSHFGYIKTK